MLNITFSRSLAWVAGVLLPVLETYRRWEHFPGPWQSWGLWLDDYLLGAFLLFAVWRSMLQEQKAVGPSANTWLAAAWGAAVGIGFMSMMGQIQRIGTEQTDPSGLANETMIAVKAVLSLLAVICLIGACRRSSYNPSNQN